MSSAAWQRLRPSYDGPASWLWFVGFARLGVLVVLGAGAQFVETPAPYGWMLAGVFAGALLSSMWYLITLWREGSVSAVLTWTQTFVDFAAVAATIAFTGGQASFFNFLFVVVILEAGVLLGLGQGFIFATLAAAFMLLQTARPGEPVSDPLLHWYNFIVQAIAFYLTAFISGYWNQRVHRMQQFQREILDNMNSGILITDDKGIVVALNKSGCRVLELAEENTSGRHVEGLLVPESGMECPITTALRTGTDFTSYEFRARVGHNGTRLIGLTTSPMRNETGLLTGMIASFTDLTEMDRMRSELQRQDRLAVVGELAAGLAHEIRNPVASIRGAVDELDSAIERPDMACRLARIAIRESDHLNEIVSSFLDFARNPSPKRETVDLRTVIETCHDRLARKYADTPAVRLVAGLPEQPQCVQGDSSQLEQVFMNLGQNAVEAMEGDGTVTFSLARHDNVVEARVEDDGPGIAPDKVARIFEPFYTEKERGVGMGLAICLRIITAHDGTIQVAARPSGGTAISVRLPAHPG